MRTNLLEETKATLAEYNLDLKDVSWVGIGLYRIPWEVFRRVADQFYDNGYGGAEVNENLIVCGDDWWLERHEYDGSEWWEFKRMPVKPELELERPELHIFPSFHRRFYFNYDSPNAEMEFKSICSDEDE